MIKFASPARLFITGTGTDVGKTFIAGALIRGLLPKYSVRYLKPVQTGYPDSDTDHLRNSLPKSDRLHFDDPLYCYALPASPDQAAAAESAVFPEPEAIAEYWQRLNSDVNMIEGAGGLMVPLNEGGDTWASFLEQENMGSKHLPVLLVASSGLGTINHTVLSVEALKRRQIPIIGIVLSGKAHPANMQSIARLLPGEALFAFDYVATVSSEVADLRYDQQCEELATFVLQSLNALETHHLPEREEELNDVVKKNVWFPYSQHQTMADPVKVVHAEGIWLTLGNGHKVIDGISSWWVNNIGHGRQEIADAIYRQQQSIDHTIFAGVWHEPAALLAKNLVEVSSPELSRVFFSDNGSTALEVALKIAFQSFTNKGTANRNTFLSLSGSYHGDTFGAMSISDSSGFHGHFKPLLFATKTVNPATVHKSAYCSEGLENLGARIADFDQEFDKHLNVLAGVVIEPLVMGAAGMLMQPPEYLRHIEKRCREFGIPLIVDEVFTGFGRTGAWFAYQRAGITPDIVACAKGLTGGTMPLAVTMAREEFFQAFLSDKKQQALMHGHSYTANPIGCAAANAAISILHREKIPDAALLMEHAYKKWIEENAARLDLEQPRALGGILAFELPGSGKSDYFHNHAKTLTTVAIDEGILLRPLGNTVYFMPPLSITKNEMEDALLGLGRVIKRFK